MAFKELLLPDASRFASLPFTSLENSFACRWCEYEPDPNGPPNVLAVGLVDFLQDNQVCWSSR